jgi:hypothetical protein
MLTSLQAIRPAEQQTHYLTPAGTTASEDWWASEGRFSGIMYSLEVHKFDGYELEVAE